MIQNMNPFFAKIALAVRSVGDLGITKKVLLGSGGRTRTSGLRVMSPTSYQLLYPAILDCKGKNIF